MLKNIAHVLCFQPSKANTLSTNDVLDCLCAHDRHQEKLENIALTAEMRSNFQSFFPMLTAGAAQRIDLASHMFEALFIAIGDKAVKSAIREHGIRIGRQDLAERVIQAAAKLHGDHQDLRTSLPKSIASNDAVAMSSEISTDQETIVRTRIENNSSIPPDATEPADAPSELADISSIHADYRTTSELLQNGIIGPEKLFEECLGLSSFRGLPLAVRTADGDYVTTFESGIALLCSRERTQQYADILAAVLSSDARLSVVMMDRAIKAERITLNASAQLQIRMATIRLLKSLNAYETVHNIINELDVSPLFHLLSQKELSWLADIRFKVQLRTGRSYEALDRARKSFFANPSHIATMLQLIIASLTEKPHAAAAFAATILSRPSALNAGDRLLLGGACLAGGDRARATQAFLDVAGGHTLAADGWIGMANSALLHHERDNWFAYLQNYGSLTGLEIDRIGSDTGFAPFDFATAEVPSHVEHPLIAIVMTVHNSVLTLEKAAASVLNQSMRNIELWIVNDCGTDGSVLVARDLMKRDSRVRVLENPSNVGTYKSKNRAIQETKADFVTFHDSDDWKCPRALEVQLAAAISGVPCNTSQWIRMDAFGHVHRRHDGNYTHLNPTSTFVPRNIFERVGLFDEVRTGADAEFITRIQNSVGWSNVKNYDRTLAIGLHHEASLTTSGIAAYDDYRHSSVRLRYTESWLEWHISELEAARKPRLILGERPFVVPVEIEAREIADLDRPKHRRSL